MTGIIATQERAGLVWGAQCWDTGRGRGAAEQGSKVDERRGSLDEFLA